MGPLSSSNMIYLAPSNWMGSRFCDLQKKKVFTEISTVFPAEIKWSPKKKRSSLKFRLFFSPPKKWSTLAISMAPFITQCNLDGPPLELMGPLNTMGPGSLSPPASPSRRPCSRKVESKYLSVKYLLISWNTGTLVWAVQKIDFWGVHSGGPQGGGTPKLC